MDLHRDLEVYVVEDSPAIRDLIIESMRATGYGSVIGYADSEEEAVDDILNLHPDAVVLDIQLKSGSGFNVLRRLKTLPKDLRPVVIVVSEYANEYLRRLAARDGAGYYLDKAFEFHNLWGVLDSLSERKAHSLQL